MSHHGQPQTWRGHTLRTIREVSRVKHGQYTASIATLDCGHQLNVSDRTRNKRGDRVVCQVCR